MTALHHATRPASTPRRRRDLRTQQRYVAAAVLLVPATAVAIGRLFVIDDSGGTRAALDGIAADPGHATTFALLGFFAMLTLVPAIYAASRLAKRRRPVLAGVALVVNLAAYLGGYALSGIDLMYASSAGLAPEHRDGAAALIDAMWQTGIAGVSTGLFVFGHLLGTALLAFALRGSIPTVGWVAMLLSQPAHVLAFVVVGSAVMDLLSWGLMAFAFACCAVAILRTADDDWDLPPLPQSSQDPVSATA